MKKLSILFLLLQLILPVFAMEFSAAREGKEEAIVVRTGFHILNANKIPYRITFFVNRNNKKINAATYYRDKSIVVDKGILFYLENEEELAAILAHEISHAIDYNQGALKGYFTIISTNLSPKKYEEKADKRAVDFLVKAGYNPLALIVAGNKLFTQPRFDWGSTHPLGSKRLASIYEYVYVKYPEYLVDNKYSENVYYQNFLITSKENRKNFIQKHQSNSNSRVNYQ